MKTRVNQIGQICLLLILCAGFTSCNKDDFYEKEFLENPYQDPEGTGDNGGQGGADSGGDGSTQGGVDAGVSGGTEGGATTGSSTGGTDGTVSGGTTGGTDGSATGGTTGGTDGSTAGGATGGTDGSTAGGATGGTDGSTAGGATGGTDGSTAGGATGGTDGSTAGGATGGTSGGAQTHEETFHQSTQKKLDIVWIIDNSGSMADEQAALATNFDAFINEFIDTQVDFKMAITTTDTSSSTKKGRMVTGSDVKLTSTKAQENPDQFKSDFRSLVQVGISGSGYEKGLGASEGFMEKYSNTFVRSDAYLAVVVVTDEEDQSSRTPAQYMDYLKSFKQDAGLIKMYSICDINRTNTGSGITTGCDRYAAASALTAGTVADIRDDFHQVLSDMGDSLINLLDSFPLSFDAVPASIVVKVNGSAVTEFTYDAASRSIKFNAGHLPPVNAEIKVTYQQQ